MPLNFVCGMKFRLRKRAECCRGPSVNRLCRRKMFISGTKTSKKAENVLMTWNESRSKIKVMLTVFFDYRGVVHYEFLPPGQTVNKEYYLSVMRRLREAIRKKRPDLWKDNSWLLHHDNAPSHTALILREFFAKNSTHIVPQPPYSPDLAPCDYWLFPKLKRPLRGHRFESIEEIQRESLRALKAIPGNDFLACFEEWKKRWHKCIVSEGEYFEGDEIDLDE